MPGEPRESDLISAAKTAERPSHLRRTACERCEATRGQRGATDRGDPPAAAYVNGVRRRKADADDLRSLPQCPLRIIVLPLY